MKLKVQVQIPGYDKPKVVSSEPSECGRIVADGKRVWLRDESALLLYLMDGDYGIDGEVIEEGTKQ